jgi:hypothetical protein
VVLKSAKDRILGVDPLGQHVPPHVWLAYKLGMLYVVCLARLSGDVHHSLCHTCDILCETPEPHSARGAFARESLAIQVCL